MSWFGLSFGETSTEENEQTNDDAKYSESSQVSFTVWGAFNALKAKSIEALEMAKNDLKEFGTALSEETKEHQEEMKKVFENGSTETGEDAEDTDDGDDPPGFSVDRLGEALGDNLEKISLGVEHIAGTVWDGTMKSLASMFGGAAAEDCVSEVRLTLEQELTLLQTNSKTYTAALELEHKKGYEQLLKDFTDRYDEYWATEVLGMLGNSAVRSNYDSLVPEAISEEDFWCSYITRKRLLEQKHERRLHIEAKLAQTDSLESLDELTWDEDDAAAPVLPVAPLASPSLENQDVTRDGEQTEV